MVHLLVPWRVYAPVRTSLAGDLIKAIARRLFFFPVLRYIALSSGLQADQVCVAVALLHRRFVDDYLGIEEVGEEEDAKHAMNIFARHFVFWPSAIALTWNPFSRCYFSD